MLRNPETAEILGAFIGDGWIESDRDGFYITGSQTEDKLYYDNFMAPLVSEYITKVIPREFPYWKVYGIAIYKRAAIDQAIHIGFPTGKKSYSAEMPSWIKESNDQKIISSFIRGIFDTDGSFWCEKSRARTATTWKRTHNHHPELRITSCSKILLEQIRDGLTLFGINAKVIQKTTSGLKHGRNVHAAYGLNVRRIADIERWFSEIGTNNPRHQTRYLLWRKQGHLPPKTTLKERLLLLDDKTDTYLNNPQSA
jgi:intein/homing endonuclease